MAKIFDFNLQDKSGKEVSLELYKGKVLLVVNTATGCGFTPQYEELEAMYKRLKDKGLEILDVPCNQFGHQAPGSDAEIGEFCTLKFGASFPQFKKSDVNGANELPLYTWLKQQKPYAGNAYEEKLAAIMEDLYNKANSEPRKKDDIQWNFTKFVVDRNGDGKITDDDKYYYKAPAAPVTMGFASRFEYRNWDLGFALRASLGNYVYNDTYASSSNMSNSELYVKSKYLVNRPSDVLADNWRSYDPTSTQTDYWVQNASFLKMDNVTLGYSFANLLKQGSWNGISGRIYGTVNNVFCITKYKGLDPEVFNGIDNNLYPRPISFILGLNLNF